MVEVIIFMLELAAILILGMVIAILLIMILTTIVVMILDAKDKIKERKEKC
jgi:hypothetical protein